MQMTETNQGEVISRDHELLRMLAQGSSNKEIASFLNLSPPAAKRHLQTLFLGLLVAKQTTSISELTSERQSTAETPPPENGTAAKPKASLYGLPCLQCHAYYCADMQLCPICKSPDRVSPNAVPALPVIPAITTQVHTATASTA